MYTIQKRRILAALLAFVLLTPPGTVRIVLGGRTYACFTTVPTAQTEFVAGIRHTWDSIRDWFSVQDEWQRAPDFEWECYTEKSRLFSEEICIPVIRHSAENNNENHNSESGANYKKVNRKMKKSEEKHTLTRNTEKSIAK